MSKQELDLFIHRQGAKPIVLSAIPGDTLREILIRVDVFKDNEDELLVFVGECSEALKEPDDVEEGADTHEPVDVSLTVEALELGRHRHVHLHRCRHVKVEVNFGAKTKRRNFSPATTVGVVTQWARNKFHLDPASAAEYVLQVCNSTDQPRPDRHLGELVEAPKCSICFDLVREVTPQG
ncbi:MAG: hypothetical protein ABSC54_03110 [Smithellaceae bacterium]